MATEAHDGGGGPSTGETEQPQETTVAAAAPETTAPPASPPLPTPHKPVAPGPRAARLQEAYAKVLKRTLAQLRWDNFAGCYPTVARRSEGVLRQVQTQMVDKLGDKCEREFDNIMASRQVVPKLNELEGLIGDASRRRNDAADDEQPTPPHLLLPPSILAAHLHPTLVSHQSQLNARLQTTQSQNAQLFEEVQRQRADIASLLDSLESVVADLYGANDALRDVVQEIAAEARQGEAAIAETTTKLPLETTDVT